MSMYLQCRTILPGTFLDMPFVCVPMTPAWYLAQLI